MDFRDKRLVPAAVAIELTHLATLFHDDVMDEAAIRRGHASANSRFGNSVAILAGDYLFARASASCPTSVPRRSGSRRRHRPAGRRSAGSRPWASVPGEDPLDHYMHVITETTGSLIATSGRFGAMFSGLPDETADLISDACLRIGVAWQLSDDVLDIASTAAESARRGHRPASGRADAAVLYALRGARPTRTRSGCASCCRSRPHRPGAAR